MTMARNNRGQSSTFGFATVLVAACLAGTAVQAQEELDRTPGAPPQAQGQFTNSVAPPPTAPQCVASVSTVYFQANTVAKVESTIEIEGCAAAAGRYTIVARIRDSAGETQTLEFEETFEHTDDQSMTVNRDYPIGQNVELVNLRTRGVRCDCAAQ